MRLTMGFLLAAYVLSQFYRVFLAVLAPALGAELGMGAEALAAASGLWFAAFALMQIPVGWALDRFGPRWPTAVLLGVGGAGGALVFSAARSALQVDLAMALLGVGCAPVLMAGYFILARAFRPALFGMLAAALLGTGSLGIVLGAAPMAAAAEAWGWRPVMLALGVFTLAVAAGIGAFCRNPPRSAPPPGGGGGSLGALLRDPGFLCILPIAFVGNAASGAIRGLWAGPWARDLYGADALTIGHVTLAMSVAMIAGTFAYGPLDRLFGSNRRAVLAGTAGLALALAALVVWPDAPFLWGAALIALVGLFGSSYPAVMAHGRGFFPPHLVGRGMTVLNLLSIGGVAAAQFGSGAVFGWASGGGAGGAGGPVFAYRMLFLSFLIPVVIAFAVYLFARDKPDQTG